MVKPKPWWLRWFTASYEWVTVYPNIYYPANANPTCGYCLAHENVHLQRQHDKGLYSWVFKYFTDKAFKFDEEVRAMRAELAFDPSRRGWRLPEMAGQLSGGVYGSLVSYQQAYTALSAYSYD
jgi:hypothetical protein